MTTAGVRTTAAVAAVVALGLAACSSPGGDPPAGGGGIFLGVRSAEAPTLLVKGQDCDQVLEGFQDFAPSVLGIGFGVASDDAFVETGAAMGAAEDAAEAPTAAPAADLDAGADRSSAAEPTGGDGATSSDTNTQEAGIDEPDTVETDGDFVYVVDEQELVILDGATAAVVSRTTLAGYGAQLLLSGDRLLAITGGEGFVTSGRGVAVDVAEPAPVDPMPTEPAAEPDQPDVDTPVEPLPVEPEPDPVPVDPVPVDPVPVDPVPIDPSPLPAPEPLPVDPPQFSVGTVIQLLDVSDRTAPVVLQTSEIEGSHVTTRVVDGVARVVVTSYPQPPIAFDTLAIRDARDAAGVEAAIADDLDDTTIDDWLPAFRTTTPGAGGPASSVEGNLVDCADVLLPEVNAGVTETSILRVDFEDGFDPGDTTTVVAEAGAVYASASTLYLAATQWVTPEQQQGIASEDWSTAIHAFDLGVDGPAVHVGAGSVPGSVLNQYSLSEYEGHLRIATTEGAPWGGESESGVHVLRRDGDALAVVGSVGGLGITETIQSVRFMGPVGYVVTFRQTDPLYVIDLADPTAPAAVGELKIPGFSSYLHPIGEGRLLGIGRDADEQGMDRGFLVSLFDVSDPTDPKQLQTWTRPDAYSAAGTDPKAFLWWAPESAAILPLERYQAPSVGAPDGYLAGMTVLDVADGGIAERGVVTAQGRYPSRAVVVQGKLWSLFGGGVAVSDFTDVSRTTFTAYR